MSVNEHYLYLSDTDSLVTHPNNRAYDFTIDLPQILRLEGEWVCALADISYSNILDDTALSHIYVCTDICQNSIIGNYKFPVLRRCTMNRVLEFMDHEFSKLYYIKVSRDQINHIRIYIKDQFLNPVSFELKSLRCTLHLKRKK